MHFESPSFLLVSAVDQPIVCIPTPRKVWVRPCHPEIKRVMQEQVCQNRADNAPLRSPPGSLGLQTVSLFHWRRQPSFDIEQRPFALHVPPNSPKQKFVVDVVEQSFDVEL